MTQNPLGEARSSGPESVHNIQWLWFMLDWFSLFYHSLITNIKVLDRVVYLRFLWFHYRYQNKSHGSLFCFKLSVTVICVLLLKSVIGDELNIPTDVIKKAFSSSSEADNLIHTQFRMCHIHHLFIMCFNADSCGMRLCFNIIRSSDLTHTAVSCCSVSSISVW